jgi:hypothetical protein
MELGINYRLSAGVVSRRSAREVFQLVPVNIGQAAVDAVVTDGQFGVVDTELCSSVACSAVSGASNMALRNVSVFFMVVCLLFWKARFI